MQAMASLSCEAVAEGLRSLSDSLGDINHAFRTAQRACDMLISQATKCACFSVMLAI